MNANIMRLESWVIDAQILDEAKVDMDETVRDAVEEMQEMAFWRIFPDLKPFYDKVKFSYFTAIDYVRDWAFGKDTVSDIDWKALEIDTIEQLYTWLRTKNWAINTQE